MGDTLRTVCQSRCCVACSRVAQDLQKLLACKAKLTKEESAPSTRPDDGAGGLSFDEIGGAVRQECNGVHDVLLMGCCRMLISCNECNLTVCCGGCSRMLQNVMTL